MLCFAVIYPDLPSISWHIFCPSLCHRNPKRGKMWQIDAVNRSKNVVEIESSYYRSFHWLFYHINVNFSLPIFGQRKRPAEAERHSTVIIKLLGTFSEIQAFCLPVFPAPFVHPQSPALVSIHPLHPQVQGACRC